MRLPNIATELRSDNMSPSLGYGLAIISVGLALLFHLSLGSLAYEIPFLPFFAAVAASTIIGGLGPGLLATGLSALIAAYFFLEPINSFDISNGRSNLQLVFFIVVALSITGLGYARKRANNLAYEERAKFEATLTSIGDAALATDTDGCITFLNGVAEKLTGWSREEAMGKPVKQVLNIVNETTRALAENPVHYVLHNGKIVGLANHTLLISKDGTERPIDDSAAPIHDKKGRLIGVVMVFRDVSERREQEITRERLLAQVEQERKRLNDLMSSVPGVVWEAWGKPDEDSQQINFVSPYVEKMLGYTTDEWLATHNFWLSIVHPDDKEEAGQVAANSFASGEGGTNRFRWVTKDGQIRWVEASDIIVKDSKGNPIGMRGVTMDVSERKALEDRVHQQTEAQRAMLENMVEGMPIGLALLDKDARVLHLNYQWARMTNTGDEVRGTAIYDISPSFADRRAQYEKVLAGEAVDLSDVPYYIPGDERTYYRDIHLRPVRDPEGAVVGMINAVIDVTERHELDKQKDALLALASHELKTPITTIKGYSQLALRVANATGDERLRRTLNTIDEQANRLTRLINEMLEVSRIQSDTLPLHEEQFDLGDLVRSVVDSLATTAPEFSIELDVTTSPTGVFADRIRIEQVITNLVQNAIKYSGDSRNVEVKVEIEPDGKCGKVSVRDYGVGIPADQQGKVFERFFRARNVFSTSFSGLGLGLYISHEIISRHGGQLWLESEEGKGSTFYFTLPLSDEAPGS